MLERFSDQACRAVVRARDEARALKHNWIGTEHLMLALIGEDSGMAAQVLESLGISLEAARWLVEVIIGRVEQAPSGQIQFTPRAAKVGCGLPMPKGCNESCCSADPGSPCTV